MALRLGSLTCITCPDIVLNLLFHSMPMVFMFEPLSSAKTHFWIPAGFRWISVDFADFLDFLDFQPEIQTEGITASGIAAVDSAATQSNFARICSQPNKLSQA